MLRYSLPLVILGVAGILNQVADKIIFPFVYPDEAEATIQLGIYGAASKIAMIMAMFTQAFRFAYEPFVFGKSKEKDSREMYAQAMKFFIIFTLLAFLAVMFYLDILRHVIGRDYWDGLRVVPIVMAAEIFMGIYFNLSFWYKLIEETRWGAYFSLTGCIILILMNIFLVPKYGYIACAGWVYRIRRCYAAFLLCRSEEISDTVRFEGDRHVCTSCRCALCSCRICIDRQYLFAYGISYSFAVTVYCVCR